MNNEITLTAQQKDYLSTTLRSFKTGEKEYDKGNRNEAAALLFGTYTYANKHNLLSLIPPTTLQRAYTLISIIQDTQGNFDRAIEFAKKAHPNGYGNTDIGIIYQHKAKKAHTDGNDLLEQECYKKAFDLFKGASTHDKRAEKHFEHALVTGTGWQYNVSTVTNYFVTRLKYSRSESEHTHALKELIKLASDDMRTQCIMVKAYMDGENNIPICHEKTLHYCQEFILHMAALPSLELLPIEYFIIPLSLKQLPFTNRTASILYAYYNALYVYKSNNKKIVEKLWEIRTVKAIPLRPYFLKIINGDIDKTLQRNFKKLVPNSKELRKFFDSDGFIVIPLLQQLLATFDGQTNSITNLLNYILGLYAYRIKHYSETQTYFNQCTGYNNHLPLECLTLLTYLAINNEPTLECAINSLNLIEKIFFSLNNTSRSEYHSKYAHTILSNIPFTTHQSSINALLSEKRYSQAYQLCFYLTQLQDMQCFAFEKFLLIEQAMAKESNTIRTELLINPYRMKINNILKKLTTQTGHSIFACHTLGNLYAQYSTDTIIAQLDNSISLRNFRQQSFDMLECSLKHGNLPVELVESNKLLCSDLAVSLAMQHQSLELCDKAINYGNHRAYYIKAKLLLSDPSAKKYEQEIRTLLEKHIETDDPIRSHSYDLLVQSLLAKPTQDNKKIFRYVSNAIELGHYDHAVHLSEYYLNGIKEDDGSYFLLPNQEQALHYLNLHIDKAKTSPALALMLRIYIHCSRNNKVEALKDMKTALQYDMCPEAKTRLLFYAGILTMLVDNREGVNLESLNYFQLASSELNELIKSKQKQCGEYLRIPLSCMDDEAFKKAYATTLHILETKDTSIEALQWCSIIGHFFLEATREKKCNTVDRKHALAILEYAAKNNLNEAQWELVYTDNTEVSLDQKIAYAEKVLIAIQAQNSRLIPTVQAKLTELYIERALCPCKNKVTFIEMQPTPVTLETKKTSPTPVKKNAELESHVLFNDLVKNKDSTYSKNTQFLTGVTAYYTVYKANPEKGATVFKQLVQKNMHPHAHLLLAMHYFKPENSDNEIAKNYLGNGLRKGIIEQKNKPSLFIDTLMVNTLYEIIQSIFAKHENGNVLTRHTKEILEAKKINTTAFQKIFLDLYTYDITKNPGWNTDNKPTKK